MSEWISVEDKLPEKTEMVLVTIKTEREEHYSYMSIFDKLGKIFRDIGNNYEKIENVIAWAEMPPPKQDPWQTAQSKV